MNDRLTERETAGLLEHLAKQGCTCPTVEICVDRQAERIDIAHDADCRLCPNDPLGEIRGEVLL